MISGILFGAGLLLVLASFYCGIIEQRMEKEFKRDMELETTRKNR